MIEIELAKPEQLDELEGLLRQETEAYLESTLRQMQMTWDQLALRFRTVGEVFAIRQGEQLAGFYWIEERDNILHLHGLILKPEYQGRGIGRDVLERLEAQAAGRVEAIELGVHKDNIRASALYKSTGYQTVRSLDELGFMIMQKRLKSPAD